MGIESIPIKPSWYPPKMPVLTEATKTKFDPEPQTLGFCWGADVLMLRYPVRDDGDTSNLFKIKWKGLELVTVKTDYYTSEIQGIWLDVDNDRKGDEFFLDKEAIEGVYGKGGWVCLLVKRVLDYWR